MSRPAVAACLLALAMVRAAFAEEAEPFIRTTNRDGITSFETGVRTYQAPGGSGPSVTLVGVVHIGDKPYYDGLVRVLEDHGLVMFESVLPRGAFGTAGQDDVERRRRTQDAMLFLRGLACDFVEANGSTPASLADLRAFAVGRDTRLARPIDLAATDGWGRPLGFRRDAATGLELSSLGADGRPGGRGADLDLVLREFSRKQRERLERAGAAPASPKPAGGRTDDARRDLYGELASALDTDLQVRSIDYDRSNWVPADLPMEELLDRLWIRGERSATIEMISNPGGFQQGILRFLLSIVSKSPAFKKMVIEALGTGGGDARRSGMSTVDSRIILDERNDAVIGQLREVLSHPAPPSSIAIFYGAAHMPDFERTLRQEFGLEPASMSWHRAMFVDEWTTKQIRARRDKLVEERERMRSSDPEGILPAAMRLDDRVEALEARLADREAARRESNGAAVR